MSIFVVYYCLMGTIAIYGTFSALELAEEFIDSSKDKKFLFISETALDDPTAFHPWGSR